MMVVKAHIEIENFHGLHRPVVREDKTNRYITGYATYLKSLEEAEAAAHFYKEALRINEGCYPVPAARSNQFH